MDIIKDPEFKEANSVFYAEIAQLKREGKAKTEHKPPRKYRDFVGGSQINYLPLPSASANN